MSASSLLPSDRSWGPSTKGAKLTTQWGVKFVGNEYFIGPKKRKPVVLLALSTDRSYAALQDEKSNVFVRKTHFLLEPDDQRDLKKQKISATSIDLTRPPISGVIDLTSVSSPSSSSSSSSSSLASSSSSSSSSAHRSVLSVLKDAALPTKPPTVSTSTTTPVKPLTVSTSTTTPVKPLTVSTNPTPPIKPPALSTNPTPPAKSSQANQPVLSSSSSASSSSQLSNYTPWWQVRNPEPFPKRPTSSLNIQAQPTVSPNASLLPKPSPPKLPVSSASSAQGPLTLSNTVASVPSASSSSSSLPLPSPASVVAIELSSQQSYPLVGGDPRVVYVWTFQNDHRQQEMMPPWLSNALEYSLRNGVPLVTYAFSYRLDLSRPLIVSPARLQFVQVSLSNGTHRLVYRSAQTSHAFENPGLSARMTLLHPEFPPQWTPEQVAEARNRPFLRVPIPNDSKEFQEVADLFYTGGYPRDVILQVNRIINPGLYHNWKAHAVMVKRLSQFYPNTTGPAEYRLWHGTDFNAANAIFTSGFQSFRCVRNAHGRGVYTARQSAYSSQLGFAKRNAEGRQVLILCRQIVGLTQQTQPPTVSQPDMLTSQVHTMVDNVNNPAIFVTEFGAAVLPEMEVTIQTFNRSP